ncbi:YpmA family protein [Desulfovirgula thermocuniculi]|uniref:YpmA family protein n=1 Tax=Desulfovirgula thermocuniculi TaxID=348842 RepID=UPI000421100F|nr:YpmA family protein [Desulfovirgula thermocuniculi]
MNEKEEKGEGKLQLIATKSFPPYPDMYKVVDFLNKTLRHKKVMFGLTKDQNTGNMIISIYEI